MKNLTVVDEYTRQCLACPVARTFTGTDAVNTLRNLFAACSVPARIRSDHGPEFIAVKARSWLEENRVGPLYIEPGATWQNGMGDSFHGRLRAECLNENWFTSIDDARSKVETWRRHYHEERPTAPWAT